MIIFVTLVSSMSPPTSAFCYYCKCVCVFSSPDDIYFCFNRWYIRSYLSFSSIRLVHGTICIPDKNPSDILEPSMLQIRHFEFRKLIEFSVIPDLSFWNDDVEGSSEMVLARSAITSKHHSGAYP